MTIARPPAAAADDASRVLLVDDHPTSLLVMELQLRSLGLALHTAGDGAAALAVLQQHPVDLLLIDCNMPGMSGYDTAAHIREQERQHGRPHLPIIAMSVDHHPAHTLRCLRSGMDGVLRKPLLPADLQALLALWLPSTAPAAGRPTRLWPAPHIDLGTLFAETLCADVAALREAVRCWDRSQALYWSHRLVGAAAIADAAAIGQHALHVQGMVNGDDRSGADAASERVQAALRHWLRAS